MKNGIFHGMSFAAYRKDDITQADTIKTVKRKAVSKSLLVDFAEDPLAWKLKGQKETTKAMVVGSLLDTMLTEPKQFNKRFAVCPFDSYKSKEAQEWRDTVIASGRKPITTTDYEEAMAQVAAVKAKPEAAALLEGASFQVAFRHETDHPFAAKGLIDLIPHDGSALVDLKTCTPSAMESHRTLSRHIFEWGYHIQAGAYCEGYSRASGNEITAFKFIFVPSKPPYICAVVNLPLPAILLGAEIYRKAMADFHKCLATNVWPSKWDGETELDLPEYAYA